MSVWGGVEGPMDGVPPREAAAYVRGHYDPRAVETPWQYRYVIRFAPS